jgi:hypothetical protein
MDGGSSIREDARLGSSPAGAVPGSGAGSSTRSSSSRLGAAVPALHLAAAALGPGAAAGAQPGPGRHTSPFGNPRVHPEPHGSSGRAGPGGAVLRRRPLQDRKACGAVTCLGCLLTGPARLLAKMHGQHSGQGLLRTSTCAPPPAAEDPAEQLSNCAVTPRGPSHQRQAQGRPSPRFEQVRSCTRSPVHPPSRRRRLGRTRFAPGCPLVPSRLAPHNST